MQRPPRVDRVPRGRRSPRIDAVAGAGEGGIVTEAPAGQSAARRSQDGVPCAPGCRAWCECDSSCNVPACDFDGGDCAECAPGCPMSWPGDGECDSSCNTAACEFDRCDCCPLALARSRSRRSARKAIQLFKTAPDRRADDRTRATWAHQPGHHDHARVPSCCGGWTSGAHMGFS